MKNNNKSLSICIVDDDIIYQYLAKEEIEDTNLVNSIMFFDDGEDAIAYINDSVIKSNPSLLPDVIFLDVNMPRMDGWDFLIAFTELKPAIEKKIIIYMVSSSIDNRDLDRAKSISEVTDYIIKPISPNQLESILRKLLAVNT